MNRRGSETSGGSNGRPSRAFWVVASPPRRVLALIWHAMEQRAIHAPAPCMSVRRPSAIAAAALVNYSNQWWSRETDMRAKQILGPGTRHDHIVVVISHESFSVLCT